MVLPKACFLKYGFHFQEYWGYWTIRLPIFSKLSLKRLRRAPISLNLSETSSYFVQKKCSYKWQKIFCYAELCDFGSDAELSFCEFWSTKNGTGPKWELGAGSLSNWIGGPPKDSSGAAGSEKGKTNNTDEQPITKIQTLDSRCRWLRILRDFLTGQCWRTVTLFGNHG